jgi:hypothetical protein
MTRIRIKNGRRRATNGADVRETTSNEDGYYEFNVPAGTWVISEVLQEGWKPTTPNSDGTEGTYTVTVPVPSNPGPIGQSFVTQVLARIIDSVVPTAHAAVISKHGMYNFGNVFVGCVSDCGSSSGGGSSSGSRKGSKSSSKSVSDVPVPQVLGEATSVLPQGAPNTGAGGTAGTMMLSVFALLAILTSIATLRAVRHETY